MIFNIDFFRALSILISLSQVTAELDEVKKKYVQLKAEVSIIPYLVFPLSILNITITL